MADVDILNHYGLQSLNPQRWPEGLFDEPEESNEAQLKATAKARKRMTTLGRAPSLQSDPRSQKASVQKDEPDPLGTSQSVVQSLKYRGLPVDDDLKLRNTFLLSSITFNPSRYLSEVHSDASTDDLLRGLNHLSQSIEQKSASLKVLVESNFERFLRAKATIDNVYKEMRDHGAEPDEQVKKPHSRQTSRNTPHFRSHSSNHSSPQSPPGIGRSGTMNEKRRYALAKETEHGTMGIRMPLIEATVKADEIWGPAMGDKGKEEELKSVLDSIDRHKDLFDHAAAIDDCVRRSDYEGLVDEYATVDKYASEARALGERAQERNQKPPDSDLHQMIITARIWLDVQSSMDAVRRNVWSKLLSSHDSRLTAPVGHKSVEPMELMAVLLQLGVTDNPISSWLSSHQEHLQYKIISSFERFRVELEIMRRRLMKNGKPSPKALATHLRAAHSSKTQSIAVGIDAPHNLRYWEKIESSLESLLSTKVGILGEVLEFWETTQGFIDGRRQRSLPIGTNGQSKKHHQLNPEDVSNLQNAPAKLCALIRDQLHKFFLQDPVDDVSSLFSPVPATPSSPATPASAMTPSRLTRFNFKLEDVPPPSPRLGESWENLAFWPPYSNSLSSSTMLGRILTTVASAAGDMASISTIKSDESQTAAFRILISDIRERFNTAACAAWIADSENCRELEDWTKSTEKPDITNMPAYFNAWQSTMLLNLHKIVYIIEVAGGSGSGNVIVPPAARHVETVQRAFRNSLYKAFDGMMQFARRPVTETNGIPPADLTSKSIMSGDSTASKDGLSSTRSVTTRQLLTVSSFQQLRSVVVPALVTLFESHFSTTITNDARVLRDSLSQMSSQIFKAYLKPPLQRIDALIHAGIADRNYTTSASGRKPDNAKPYVFETLGCLVLLHTEISATTPGLTNQVLSHCLEHISSTLIDAFTKKQGPFPLPTLTQATLDVEFLAQTLNTYTTDRCSEIQGKIYLAMDEKTDNESRLALQKELPEMRAVLKRLRESTRGAFGCFRRQRRPEGRGRDDSTRGRKE